MAGKTPRILIIDDNEDIITMIRMMLEMNDYKAFIKTNAIDIENYIKDLMPDLIIMDMLLSGSDGRAICTSIKQNPELSHIPVLMISAHPNAQQDCMEAGADFFLGKPFDIKHFLQTIEKSLRFKNEL